MICCRLVICGVGVVIFGGGVRCLDFVLVFFFIVFFLELEMSEFGFILWEIGVVRVRLVEGGRGRIFI